MSVTIGDPIWSLVLVPLGLGLFGFIEPCSIGSSLIFIKAVEGKPAATRLMQATIFTLTRAVFIGILGALAALIGTVFLVFQKAGWIILGSLYVALGLVYLTGNAARLMRTLGPGAGHLSTVRGTAGLAILFGLNIPACAAPLLGAILGSAAVGGAAQIVQGFASLAIFGLALSLPLALALFWGPARRALDRLNRALCPRPDVHRRGFSRARRMVDLFRPVRADDAVTRAECPIGPPHWRTKS